MKATVQRLALIAYSLLLAYCFSWIPWNIYLRDGRHLGAQYGWLWDRPQDWPYRTAAPDLTVIVLRVLAIGAIAAAAWLAVPLLDPAASLSAAIWRRTAGFMTRRRRRIALAISCAFLITVAGVISFRSIKRRQQPLQLELQDVTPAAHQ